GRLRTRRTRTPADGNGRSSRMSAAVQQPTRNRAAQMILGNRSIGEFILDQRAFIALIVLIIVFASMSDTFLSGSNLVTMTRHVAYNALLALGMLLVILTAGIDLSVGSIVGLSGIVAGIMLRGMDLSIGDLLNVTAYPSVLVVVLVSILVGTFVGWINGMLITRFNVAPFIATLGTLYMA